jgi:hypothetical protein
VELPPSLVPVPTPVALVPSGTPRATVEPTETARAERPEALPDLDDVILPDAPVAVFHQRENEDLLRRAWSPVADEISPLEPRVVVPGAFEGYGRQTATVAVASPDDRLIAIRGLGSFGGDIGDRVRLLTQDGRELWSTDDADGFPVSPIWSPDGRRLVLPGPEGAWHILQIDGETVSEVPLAESWLPERPAGSPRPQVASRAGLEPIGFSVDARSLYTVERRTGGIETRPAARFGLDDGSYEPIHQVPNEGADALSPTGRLGYDSDPLTGRRYASPGLMLSTGPTDIRVSEANGEAAFTIKLDAVMGLAWAGDGRLLALEVDQVPEPSQLRLVPIDEDGVAGEPLLESGPISWATLVGVRDGHALVALATSGWDGEAILVMVRLEDGATATLPISLWLFSELEVGGWLNAAR